METLHFIVVIGLICSTSSLPGNTDRKEKTQFASSSDISLLARGLYLVGKGLREHTDKTKEEMTTVLELLDIYNTSIVNLGDQVRLIESAERALGSKAEKLELQDQELHQRFTELRSEQTKAMQGQQSVASKVDSLEGKLERILGTLEKNKSADIPFNKSVIEFHNQHVDDILALVKAQQQQIDEQNMQIQLLVNKISDFSLKEQFNFKKNVKGNDHLADHWKTQKAALSDTDCHQLFKRGERTSGVYSIQPQGSQLLQTYCQMTPESGWTVIQRRFDGSVDFDRSWLDYKAGFGDVHGEFWLGLESFYRIGHQDQYVLRIELEDWKNVTQFIEYTFKISGKDSDYSLIIGQVLTGDLSSALSDCKEIPFSTKDRDNDLHTDINCAEQHSGGWWFSACGESNLNGKYLRSKINRRTDRKKGIFWKTWKGNYYSFKSTQLMIRPMKIMN
ncbi:angiopoietin-related protein 3-like [Hemiscyllium ocellatum]|uniref:angiopoietin-related protein 3-like n=1 Tax=Hemiscyllium ocellatum TaxID=170820 RepID=UPI002966A8AA|nr:angiopoietin-related protein 3-like [Hemiscyllium ocellatum]